MGAWSSTTWSGDGGWCAPSTTGPCRPPPLVARCAGRCARPARASRRAGTSSSSPAPPTATCSGRPRPPRRRPRRRIAGCGASAQHPASSACSDPQAYVERYARPDKRARRPGPAAQDWPIPYWDVDAGMGALLMLLSAVDDGLGGLLFGIPGPRHDAVRDAFGIPADRRLVGVVALGYAAPPPTAPTASTAPTDGGSESARDSSAAARPHRPRRRPLRDVVHDGSFGSPAPWLERDAGGDDGGDGGDGSANVEADAGRDGGAAGQGDGEVGHAQ